MLFHRALKQDVSRSKFKLGAMYRIFNSFIRRFEIADCRFEIIIIYIHRILNKIKIIINIIINNRETLKHKQ